MARKMSWVKLYILVATDPKPVGTETELAKPKQAMEAGMLFVPA